MRKMLSGEFNNCEEANAIIEKLRDQLRKAEKILKELSLLDCWECHDLEGVAFNNHIEKNLCYQHAAKQYFAKKEAGR